MKVLSQFSKGSTRLAPLRSCSKCAFLYLVALMIASDFCNASAESLRPGAIESTSSYRCLVDSTSAVVSASLVSTQKLTLTLSISITPFPTNAYRVRLTNVIVSTEMRDKGKVPSALTNSFAPRFPESLVATLGPGGSLELKNFENWLKQAEGPGVESIFGVFNPNSLKLLLKPILPKTWPAGVGERSISLIQRPFNTGFSEVSLTVPAYRHLLPGKDAVRLSGENRTNFVIAATLREDVKASIDFEVVIHEFEGVISFKETSSAQTSTPAARANIGTTIQLFREHE